MDHRNNILRTMKTFPQLPAEFIRLIMLMCERGQLPTMAKVNQAFRFEAERLIYTEVSLDISTEQAGRLANCCLESLLNSPEKARLVRSFCFKFDRGTTKYAIPVCAMLRKVLLTFTSLRHLDVRVRESQSTIKFKPIDEAIRRCSFTIESLRFRHELGLDDWAAEQQSLSYIEIHHVKMPISHNQLCSFRSLFRHATAEKKLDVCCLLRNRNDFMIVFPAFAPVVDGVTTWSCDAIRQRYGSGPQMIVGFYIYLNSLDEYETVQKVLGDIGQHFRSVWRLVIQVNDESIHTKPWHLGNALAPLQRLQSLEIRMWNSDFHPAGPYQGQRKELADAWTANCPNVTLVTFPDGETVQTVTCKPPVRDWLDWF